eukprot:SAG22_NODE_681_length_7933_cov_27.729257_7_plen_38_part_00
MADMFAKDKGYVDTASAASYHIAAIKVRNKLVGTLKP